MTLINTKDSFVSVLQFVEYTFEMGNCYILSKLYYLHRKQCTYNMHVNRQHSKALSDKSKTLFHSYLTCALIGDFYHIIERYCDTRSLHQEGMYITPSIGGKVEVGTRIYINCYHGYHRRCADTAFCMPGGRLEPIGMMCHCEGWLIYIQNDKIIFI